MSNAASQLAQVGTLAQSRLLYLILYANDLTRARDFYEKTLGLTVLESDGSSAKYDTGQTILCLRKASEFGVGFTSPDRSADVTFLVDDLDKVRDSLSGRGVKFSDTLRYEIGATVDFYDPDGHWISLYQPSDAAMSWPSGQKLKAILRAGGKDPTNYENSNIPRRYSVPTEITLRGREIVYLFVFVPDPDVAFEFYSGVLGFRDLERRSCRRGSTENELGVVKYDAGGLMLTTHHREIAPTPKGQQDSQGLRETSNSQSKAAALVFGVNDLDHVTKALSQKSIDVKVVDRTRDGRTAKLEDPFGRVLYLLEPSSEALKSRAGLRIDQIMAAPL
jgi:catechol 2,3-dioxygenase-like lactoylglutathione lyase family enzyme